MKIRFLEESDRSRVVEILNEAIGIANATALTNPVSVESRSAWFDEHTRENYPIYVEEVDGVISGWCSISPYRAGRGALRFTAEISYYVSNDFKRQGVATRLVLHAIEDCGRLGIKNLFGILLDTNEASIRLLEKLGFGKWGHMPNVADFDGTECAHVYYGKRIG